MLWIYTDAPFILLIEKTFPIASLLHQQNGQHLHLLSEKAIYWQEEECLLLADIHLGKVGHFRKAGIPVPPQLHKHDLDRLGVLLEQTAAKKMIFLGDLFHSDYNQEWIDFTGWMETYPEREFILIKGNHDILPEAVYQQSPLQVFDKELAISPFLLTHAPLADKTAKEGLYNISGHVHPAVQLKGVAFQQLTLPCFYFGLHYALLPAFGKFTGFYKIKPKWDETVFAITRNRIIRL